MIANAVNAYLSKPSEPEFQVTTEERTTQGASTILTTTKPTPAPTEPPEFDDVHIEHVSYYSRTKQLMSNNIMMTDKSIIRSHKYLFYFIVRMDLPSFSRLYSY